MRAVLLSLLAEGVAYSIAAAILGTGESAFSLLIIVFLSFFAASGISWTVAKSFGGIGDFKTHVYVSATHGVPLTILVAVLAVIPGLGDLIALVGLVYDIYLGVLGVSSVHRISTGKSLVVWLTHIAVEIVLVACVLIGVVILFLTHLPQ